MPPKNLLTYKPEGYLITESCLPSLFSMQGCLPVFALEFSLQGCLTGLFFLQDCLSGFCLSPGIGLSESLAVNPPCF
jgi:hypothetical protein